MNPYREARLNLGWTQKAVANYLDITPQVLLRLEQGLFSSPPPKVTEFYSHSGEDNLPERYYAWVYNQRKANGKTLAVARAIKDLNNAHEAGRLPHWLEFRKNYLGLTVAACSKLMVIQISILQDFEKSHRNATQIQDILLNWGVPIDLINWEHHRTIKERSASTYV